MRDELETEKDKTTLMAHLVYIRGLSRAGFRVPVSGGSGWAKVTSGGTTQVDLDNHVTQWILNSERDNFIRVSGSGISTAYIIGLTRYGFRVIPNGGGPAKVIKIGNPVQQVNLADYKTCRTLRRSYGRYAVVSGTGVTTVAIYGTANPQKGFEVGVTNATATLTSDGTLPVAGDTVTINNVTYRFESTLALANDVKIGATVAATLISLGKAVNQNGTVGTDYFTGTVAPTNVTAGTPTSTTITFTDSVPGPSTFASTETSAHLSFGATTFQGGVVGNSQPAASGTNTKVYRGQSVTIDIGKESPYNYAQLRRFYKRWIEA